MAIRKSERITALKHALLSDGGFIDFARHLLRYLLITTSIHEWCHLMVLKALGCDGYIVWTAAFAAVIPTKWPSSLLDTLLVAFSGGYGAALYIGLFEVYRDNDYEAVCIGYGYIVDQVIYGTAEGLLFANIINESTLWIIAEAAALIGLTLSAILYAKWRVMSDVDRKTAEVIARKLSLHHKWKAPRIVRDCEIDE